jgi:hypothetical protein
MIKTIAPALKALVENVIDYAGLFPPAALPIEDALKNYSDYRCGDYTWMLRWFVVNAQVLDSVPPSYDGCLTVIAAAEQTRAATLETTAIVQSEHPVYCEVSLKELEKLKAVKEANNFAKIRTGGLKAETIPSPSEVAAFITECARLRLPFKATAGLHHPIRAEYPLTYEPDAPRAVMHGFLNVLLASAFAWHGNNDIVPILSELDAKAFRFDDSAHWQNQSLTLDQIVEARKNFIHSIGSCSFFEPVHELQGLGLL